MSGETHLIALRLDEELHRELDDCAGSYGMTVVELVGGILSSWHLRRLGGEDLDLQFED